MFGLVASGFEADGSLKTGVVFEKSGVYLSIIPLMFITFPPLSLVPALAKKRFVKPSSFDIESIKLHGPTNRDVLVKSSVPIWEASEDNDSSASESRSPPSATSPGNLTESLIVTPECSSVG